MRRTKNTKSEEKDSVESLERYFSIMKNKSLPKFKICKKIPININLDSEIEELWKAHEKAMKKLSEKEKDIQHGKVDLEKTENPENSLLDLKTEIAEKILESCHFCEHRCEVNRKEGEKGICGVGKTPRISSEFIHLGEEPELVPSYTIFFSGCTFQCKYCQNWGISQKPKSGQKTTTEKISSKITNKRKNGAKNVNWVGGDPTSNLHNILKILKKCETNIPNVWNSNMYLSKEGIKLISGTQDLYLTDFKYGNDECALKYSKAKNYWKTITRNHKKSFENADMIIRHLVLPEHIDCCTKNILKWIKNELGPKTRVNIMGQYRPEAKAREFDELSRRVSGGEMNQAFEFAKELGLENLVR